MANMEELQERAQRVRALIAASATRNDYEMVAEYSECLAKIEEEIARKRAAQ